MGRKKFILIVVAAVAAGLCLAGCSMFNSLAGYDENTMIIKKSGKINELIVEQFSDSNYSEETLKTYVDGQIEAYNTNAAIENAVTVQSLTVDNGVVRMELDYEGFEHYRDFNNVVFDMMEGSAYSLEASLTYVNASGGVVSQHDIDKNSYRVVVTDVASNIIVPGKVEYVSDNVTVTDSKCVKTAGDISVIFYKD